MKVPYPSKLFPFSLHYLSSCCLQTTAPRVHQQELQDISYKMEHIASPCIETVQRSQEALVLISCDEVHHTTTMLSTSVAWSDL